VRSDLGARDVAALPRFAPAAGAHGDRRPCLHLDLPGRDALADHVALAVSGNLYGDVGLALASVAMVAIIPLVNVFSVAVLAHYASPEKQSARAIVMTVVRNPLIWACAIGLAPDDRLKNAKPARSPAPPRRNC
jgi:malonate transporter